MTRSTATLLAIVLLAGCQLDVTELPEPLPADTSPTMRELITAERLWATSRPQSYEFAIDVRCFCGGLATVPPRYRVTGTTATSLGPSPPWDGKAYGRFNTVEKLFLVIRESVKRDGHRVTVSYDPDLGYPQVADLDPIATAVDDELFFRVIDFRKQ
jgi:hypothetical protein